jgi:hypothetical protein
MSFIVPRRLVGNKTHLDADNSPPSSNRSKTVYTVRLTTSSERNATHSDTSSGVLLCLISEEESSVIKFIPTTSSELSSEGLLRDVCASGDIPSGADCSLIMGSPTPTGSNYCRHRFLSGSTTEVSFVAPDLGHLAAVIVGPQSGTWGCSEVIVSSSADNGVTSSKFLSKDRSRILGEDPMYSASYLVRVPYGSILYGEGTDAKILSASEAMEIATRNMTWYEEMKKKMKFYTATVGVVGSVLAFTSLGASAATSFGFGSILSLWYQVGLQRKVDNIGSTASSTQERSAFLTGLLPLLGASFAAWWVYAHPEMNAISNGDTVESASDTFTVIVSLMAGLASQKIALLVFSAGIGSSEPSPLRSPSGTVSDRIEK